MTDEDFYNSEFQCQNCKEVMNIEDIEIGTTVLEAVNDLDCDYCDCKLIQGDKK